MADGTIGSTAVVGSTNWLNSDKTHIMPNADEQATISGSLYKIDIYTQQAGDGTIDVRVYRINGLNYDYVGGKDLTGLGSGLNSNVAISPEISVQADDIIGVFEATGGTGIKLTVSAGDEENKAGDQTGTTVITDWATAGYLLSIKGYISPINPGFMVFLCEAYDKGNKYFKNKKLWLPDIDIIFPKPVVI